MEHKTMLEVRKKYDNLNGLRVISCLCIIAMHIKANSEYIFNSYFNVIVDSWTQFVPLFLMISGFGMFCGYYDKVKNNKISMDDFYKKRYNKILPFFATLVILDIIMERSLNSLVEGAMEITLVFGLLPNNTLDVIGVSWTLGVIFLFYMLFPFFVFLFWNKRRAWITFLISIVISYMCSCYFFSDRFVVESFPYRHSILFCVPWIMTGSLIYLYKDAIIPFVGKYRWICFAFCIIISIFWYIVPGNIVLKNIIVFASWLMYAISVNSKILNNKITAYLSDISLELYLAQMVMYRIVEKLNGLYIFGRGCVSFFAVWIMIIIGLVLFIEIWKKCVSIIYKI